jgi:nicotinamidase-related amidase
MSFKYLPGKTVEVPDLPYQDHLSLIAEKTALIIVDMQNDFVKQGGHLVVPDAQDSVSTILSLVKRARVAGVKIVYTQDTAFPRDKEFEIWPEHCLIDTPGWQIIDDLLPQKGDLVCMKNRYDGFYGTWLDHFIDKVWHMSTVVIVGTVSNICVLHTAASAGLRWYHVVVPADGITAFTEFDQALTLHQVSSLYNGSIVKSVDDILFRANGNEHKYTG